MVSYFNILVPKSLKHLKISLHKSLNHLKVG